MKKIFLTFALLVNFAPVHSTDVPNQHLHSSRTKAIITSFGVSAFIGFCFNLDTPQTDQPDLISNSYGGTLALLTNLFGLSVYLSENADTINGSECRNTILASCGLSASGYLAGSIVGGSLRKLYDDWRNGTEQHCHQTCDAITQKEQPEEPAIIEEQIEIE